MAKNGRRKERERRDEDETRKTTYSGEKMLVWFFSSFQVEQREN